MNTVKSFGPLAVASSTKCKVLSVGCSTETSFPGLPAHLRGEASSLLGAELAVGLLLISLFAAALLTPFERLIPQERNGKKSLRSTSIGSQRRRSSGGTGGGQYDEG